MRFLPVYGDANPTLIDAVRYIVLRVLSSLGIGGIRLAIKS